jgi:hydrogenase expression/formation protein HypC
MCIGIAMKVVSADAGRALVQGRGEQREVETLLVGDVQPGEWLLIFLNSARERLNAERAEEINATLDLLAGVLGGFAGDDPAAFTLPSAMSVEQLAALAGLETTP